MYLNEEKKILILMHTFSVFLQVDLILQGDDVTRQMWHMYSVFEEIFGHQATTGERPLKQVVVGDKIKKSSAKAPSLQQRSLTNTATRATENTVASPEKISATTSSTICSTTSTIGMFGRFNFTVQNFSFWNHFFRYAYFKVT